jgi:hypothetical protein
VLLVLALPIAVLAQLVFGPGADAIAIHVMLGLGMLLAASAAFDFATPAWVRWLGSVPSALLAVVFLLQALTEITHSEALGNLAYGILGQQVEGWLLDGFIVWALAAVLAVSRGKTRVLGLVAVSATLAVDVYRYVLLAAGSSMNDVAGGLKLVALLVVVWLFVQSTTRTASRQR